MAKSGCKEVSLGCESGSEHMLCSMNKRFKPDDVRWTCALLKDFGIRRMGFLLLGGPGETKESVEESLSFAESVDLDMLKISIGIRIYPYTRLAKIAVEEGIIPPEDSLLSPKFYIEKGLESWLRSRVQDLLAKKPTWFL
jgi:radical SAM superfamily enzyme YgiQ (UPF0313 family)